MADKSFARLHILWSYAVTGDDMNPHLTLELRLIGTKNSDEFLIAMVLHIATDDDDAVRERHSFRSSVLGADRALSLEFDHGGLDTKPMLLCVRFELFCQCVSNQFVDMAALPTYRKSHYTMMVFMVAATQVGVHRFQAMHVP